MNRVTPFNHPAVFAAALLVCCFAAKAAETPDQTALALAQKALTNSTAMEIVTDLSTEIGPRLAGSENEKRAAEWAKRRFEQLGCDRVWIESFPLENGWARGVEQAEVIGPSPQPLAVTALGSSPATPAGGLEAEIALFRTYDSFLAASPDSVSGKIVVVTQPMERAQSGSGYGAVNRVRAAGPAEAARRGAAAYLLRSLGTSNDRVPHTGMTRFPEGARRIPAAALSVPDADQLERLAAKGKPVRVKLVLTPRDLGTITSWNVIAELKGREKPGEIVLLGAHLDSWDLGTGAVDDGAGVAMIMAAGKLIRDLPQRPRRTIRVVLFGSEEVGLVGGRAYAQTHRAELPMHVIAAEPDVGQGPVYAFQTGVADPAEPSLDRIRAALSTLGIAADHNNNARGNSDIGPIADLGVPVAGLRLDATEYFDLHHNANDTLDKIKPERLNQSTAAYTVFAYLAAELGGHYRAVEATK